MGFERHYGLNIGHLLNLVEDGPRSLRVSLAADGHGDVVVAVANVLQDLHRGTEQNRSGIWEFAIWDTTIPVPIQTLSDHL